MMLMTTTASTRSADLEVIDGGMEHESIHDASSDEDILASPRKSEAESISWTERRKRRLRGAIRINKGLTIDSGAADHVMP